ncbi:EndoU domain-containing protein [Micavibrio aeruginosavorus]|uniref:Bacterial EndoU nuclease domain-containing protein n=1 Tax=Micavibrio aeruginosavorus (strain ARL-13) TaxID=856793 RepID=G2KSC9_MICAA|nr:EndoU domain-containing protein [Micavibrio aeruginosavorus]AEP09213.1 hypothetical protein MICA_880 [Micavibrio aeruginosavorus ARL-13]
MKRKTAVMAVIPTLVAMAWFVVGIVNTAIDPPHTANQRLMAEDIRISEPAIQHILYGDNYGGGHLHGANVPCKSEFPSDWSADDVINTVRTMTANDNQDWRKEDNGYHVGENTIRGVRVRVVLDRDGDDVITAYPLNTRRNPCPRTANNDNNP